MAITVVEALAFAGSAQGPTTLTYADLTPPTDAQALIVGVASTDDDSISATYGGVAMTEVVDPNGLCKIYELLDLSGVSGDDLVITKAWYVQTGVEAAWLVDTAPVIRVDENSNPSAGINGPGNWTTTLDAGAATGCAAYIIGAASRSGGVGTGSIDPYASGSQTQLSEGQIPVSFHPPGVNVSYRAGISGSVTVGIVTAGGLLTQRVAAALYGPSDVVVEPGRMGEETAFRAGIEVVPATDVVIYPTRMGEETAFRAGVIVRPFGPRQVALVGRMLETSEMTEGGEEGWVLTYHETEKPTWEDSVGGGGGALDDLTDVDAPTPSDGDVLTWDDAAGEWVAAAPTGGTAAVPPALRVYLYTTFK
jgi:hypothetical protein